jgi:hypothetical protein
LAGNEWHDFDLTAATGGPKALPVTSVADVADTTQNLIRVNYVGTDSHVHEFYLSGGVWHDFDLTTATGGPQAANGTPIADVVDTIQHVMRVNYVGADSHVHEFYLAENAWHDFDLTAESGGLPVTNGSSIADVVDTTQTLMRVHYLALVQSRSSAWGLDRAENSSRSRFEETERAAGRSLVFSEETLWARSLVQDFHL